MKPPRYRHPPLPRHGRTGLGAALTRNSRRISLLITTAGATGPLWSAYPRILHVSLTSWLHFVVVLSLAETMAVRFRIVAAQWFRSEERRDGKEGVSTGRYRGWPY